MSDRIKHQIFDRKFNSPFKMDLSVEDTKLSYLVKPGYKSNSNDAKTSDENKKFLEQMKELEWIRDKSMLEMVDLFSKYKDRQPELLATLQPNIKSDLLHNPTLFTTMEQLEKRKPINDKVADIKNFMGKIKTEAFGEFKKDFGGMIYERAL